MTDTDAPVFPERPPVAEPLPAWRRAWRWAEMVLVFFGIPALIALYVDPQQRAKPLADAIGLGFVFELPFPPARVLMPALGVFTLVVLGWLIADRTFPKRWLWNWAGFKKDLGRIGVLFVVGGGTLFAVGWALATRTELMTITDREGVVSRAFWRLPRENIALLLAIGVVYPWLSAYPQEITHRAFFFHRYERLFAARGPGRWAFFAVNALAFAWLHAPFWNGIALLLTLPGGFLFAWTYARTRSTLAAGMEHGLYGWWAFAVGLGYFVFAGSIGQ